MKAHVEVDHDRDNCGDDCDCDDSFENLFHLIPLGESDVRCFLPYILIIPRPGVSYMNLTDILFVFGFPHPSVTDPKRGIDLGTTQEICRFSPVP